MGTVSARVPLRVASELGRKEFVLVSLVEGEDGKIIAFPTGKGSGAVTSFSQADGFFEIAALASALDAESQVDVTLIGSAAHAPDVVIMGSHDVALDVVVGALVDRGFGPDPGRRQPRRCGSGNPRRMRYRPGSPDRPRKRTI